MTRGLFLCCLAAAAQLPDRAEWLNSDFQERVNDFVRRWNLWIKEVNDSRGQVINRKKAREIVQAFERLTRHEGWPQ